MKRPPTPAHWSANLRRWYADCIEAARKLRPGFTPMPFEEVRWQVTARASRKAGVCWSAQKRIWLHGAMTPEHALETFRHEVAHLWANWYGSGTFTQHHHDSEWRYWARMLGDDGERCHDYKEVEASKRGTWAHCLCNEYKKLWRHGDPTTYKCRKCRAFLKPGQRPAKVIVAATVVAPVAVKMCAEMAADPTESVSVKIRSLSLELGLLKEGGHGSTPEAKKIRVMLRKLDPEWRTR